MRAKENPTATPTPLERVNQARDQARRAYHFSPGSYTYHALRELFELREALREAHSVTDVRTRYAVTP